MSKITFDTEDYYDDDTLQEMIEYETQRLIRKHVEDMFNRKTDGDSFIYYVARRTVQEELAGIIPAYKIDIMHKVGDVIEATEDYQIRYDDAFKKTLSECIEECRPMIKKQVENACSEKLDASYLVNCVCDEFYNMLSKMLTKD